MNSNILKQEIDDIDTITVVHEESQNFKSYDAWGFYNYATNFDWGAEAENKDKFISSKLKQQENILDILVTLDKSKFDKSINFKLR